MKVLSLSDSIENPSCITYFTFIHFYTGFIFYIIMKYFFPKWSFLRVFLLWILLHSLYEVKDMLYYWKIKITDDYWGDNSFINSIFDTIATLLGLWVGYLCVPNISYVSFWTNIIVYAIVSLYFIASRFG